MSSPDLGHDLTSVNILLSKHRANEDEISARGQRLDGVKAEGTALMEADSFGAEKIQCTYTIMAIAMQRMRSFV